MQDGTRSATNRQIEIHKLQGTAIPEPHTGLKLKCIAWLRTLAFLSLALLQQE
jgi:hypothetical protein